MESGERTKKRENNASLMQFFCVTDFSFPHCFALYLHIRIPIPMLSLNHWHWQLNTNTNHSFSVPYSNSKQKVQRVCSALLSLIYLSAYQSAYHCLHIKHFIDKLFIHMY